MKALRGVWVLDPRLHTYIGPRDMVLPGWLRQQIRDELCQPIGSDFYKGSKPLTEKDLCLKGEFV